MKILFTICGRSGSKGIKNKNIKDFLGNPLSYYTLSAIDLFLKKNADIEYDIVVSSDSEKLLNIMANNPIRRVDLLRRDSSLAGDRIGKIDVIHNCLNEMESRTGQYYDVVVDLDITSPLRKGSDIEELIKVHFNKRPDVTASVTTARRNPYFNQVMRTESGVKRVIETNFTARQQAPLIYDMNASIYAYSPVYLRSGKGVLDGHCEIIEMFDTGVLDIDHENDFELLEVIAGYLFEKYSEFREIKENIQGRER